MENDSRQSPARGDTTAAAGTIDFKKRSPSPHRSRRGKLGNVPSVPGFVPPDLSPDLSSGTIFRYSIFRGFPKMHERCPVCDLKFAREAGYFLGAMYISYGIALVTITLIAALLWRITGWWITKDTVWAVVLFLPLAPTIALFSRVLWIYLDQTIDPEQR